MALGGQLSSLHVDVGADLSEFNRKMASMGNRVRATAKKVQAAGRKMSAAITVPMAAAGGAALKFASDMEQSLAQAQSQAGLTDRAMQQISDSAEEIAISTGQSFGKVVDAFKFAQSAGLDMAESQEIVETSAKAAAAGFGDQTTLLRGMTTVMAGFGDEAGGASQIMDKMVATAQQMEVEVPALTEVMGQLVQVSSEVGVGFDEMLAAVGSVGEQFGDVKRAGNLMATAMTQLLDPSKKVRGLMKQAGTSAAELQANIEQKGITQAMVELREKTEAAGIEFARMVGSARSARVMLALTSDQGRRVSEIMQNARDSTGALNQAFQESQSFSRLLSRAWEALRISLRPLGEVLIDTLSPALSKMITQMQKLSKRFQSMTADTRAWWLAMSALAGLSGPVLFFVGSLTSKVWALGKGIVSLLSSLGLVGGLFLSIGVAVGVVIDRWESFTTFFSRSFQGIVDSFESGTTLIVALWQKAMALGRQATAWLAEQILGLFADVAQFAASVGVDVAKPWAGAFALMENQASQAATTAGDQVEALGETAEKAAQRFGQDFIKGFGRLATSSQFFVSQGMKTWRDFTSFLQGKFQSLQDLFMSTGDTLGMEAVQMAQNIGLLTPPLQKLERQLQRVDQSMAGLAESIGLLDPPLQGLIDRFRQAGNESSDLKEKVKDSLKGVGIRAATRGFNILGKKIGGAADQAEKLKDAISLSLSQIGEILIQLGLESGNLLVAGAGVALTIGGGFVESFFGGDNEGQSPQPNNPPRRRQTERLRATADVGIEQFRLRVSQNAALHNR